MYVYILGFMIQVTHSYIYRFRKTLYVGLIPMNAFIIEVIHSVLQLRNKFFLYTSWELYEFPIGLGVNLWEKTE